MLGRVKCCKTQGYGFIITEDGTNFFFHYQEYKGDWDELKKKVSEDRIDTNPVVQFQAVEHKRGPRAIKVELVDLT